MKPHKLITNGLFISFEGMECAGKSTQSKLISRCLRDDGYQVLETREPGGTQVGEELRHIVKHVCGDEAVCDEAELFIFAASRAQLACKVILPFLQAGGIVITDRYADSTTAYQGYARGFELELIRQLNETATCGRWPDLTILLDLDVKQMEDRGQLRLETLLVQDRIEEESRRFHQKVRDGYLEIARMWPARFLVIDATEDRESIHRRILEHVNNAIAGRNR